MSPNPKAERSSLYGWSEVENHTSQVVAINLQSQGFQNKQQIDKIQAPEYRRRFIRYFW
jgi:hypothetical protein